MQYAVPNFGNLGGGSLILSSANASNTFVLGGLSGSGAVPDQQCRRGHQPHRRTLNTATSFSGTLTGAGTLTKVGTGTLTFPGTTATNNSFSGGVVINGGMLLTYTGSTFPTATYNTFGTGPITLNPGGTLYLVRRDHERVYLQ